MGTGYVGRDSETELGRLEGGSRKRGSGEQTDPATVDCFRLVVWFWQ